MLASSAGAAAVAVVATAVSLAVGLASSLEHRSVAPGDYWHTMFFATLFGGPIAFFVAWGLSAAMMSRSSISVALSVKRVTVTGAVTGAILLPLSWGVFWGDWNDLAPAGVIGAIAGLVGGAAFRLIFIRLEPPVIPG